TEAKALARVAAGSRHRHPKNKIPVAVAAKFQWQKPSPKTAVSVAETTTGKTQIPSGRNHHYFLNASHCSPTGNDSSGNSDAVQQPERGTDLTDEDFIPEFLTRRHSG